MRTLAEDMSMAASQLKLLDEQLHIHINNSQTKIVSLVAALNSRMGLQQRMALPQLPPFRPGVGGNGSSSTGS